MERVRRSLIANLAVATASHIIGISGPGAFTSGWLGDRLITRSGPDPRPFADEARRPAADTTVLLNPPGGRVSIP